MINSFRYDNSMIWATFEPTLMFLAMKWIFYFKKIGFSSKLEFLGVQLMKNASNQKIVLDYLSWGTNTPIKGVSREI